jgi:hypothetical protein
MRCRSGAIFDSMPWKAIGNVGHSMGVVAEFPATRGYTQARFASRDCAGIIIYGGPTPRGSIPHTLPTWSEWFSLSPPFVPGELVGVIIEYGPAAAFYCLELR